MQRDLIIRNVPASSHHLAIAIAAWFERDYPDREAGVRHGVGYYDPARYPLPLLVYRTRTAIVVRGQSHD